MSTITDVGEILRGCELARQSDTVCLVGMVGHHHFSPYSTKLCASAFMAALYRPTLLAYVHILTVLALSVSSMAAFRFVVCSWSSR